MAEPLLGCEWIGIGLSCSLTIGTIGTIGTQGFRYRALGRLRCHGPQRWMLNQVPPGPV